MSNTMRLSPDEVKRQLVAVLETISGLGPGRVVWEGGGGPRPPEGLYCSLDWKEFEPLPQNDGEYWADPGQDAGQGAEANPNPNPNPDADADADPDPDAAPDADQNQNPNQGQDQSPNTGQDQNPNTGANPNPNPDADKTRPLTQGLRHETWCTVRISFRGPGAFTAATAALQGLHSGGRWFDLWRTLGYGGTDAVRDDSAALGGRIQARAYFHLSFYACFGAHYPAEWFDVSQWDIEYAGQNEQFDYSRADREIPEDCRCLPDL